MFRAIFSHPQERKTVFYSMLYNAPKLLPAGGEVRGGTASSFHDTGRQQLDCIIQHAVKNSLALLRMGKKLPETCWANCNINKLLFVASSWSSTLFISMIHDQTNIKYGYAIFKCMSELNSGKLKKINYATQFCVCVCGGGGLRKTFAGFRFLIVSMAIIRIYTHSKMFNKHKLRLNLNKH